MVILLDYRHVKGEHQQVSIVFFAGVQISPQPKIRLPSLTRILRSICTVWCLNIAFSIPYYNLKTWRVTRGSFSPKPNPKSRVLSLSHRAHEMHIIKSNWAYLRECLHKARSKKGRKKTQPLGNCGALAKSHKETLLLRCVCFPKSACIIITLQFQDTDVY